MTWQHDFRDRLDDLQGQEAADQIAEAHYEAWERQHAPHWWEVLFTAIAHLFIQSYQEF